MILAPFVIIGAGQVAATAVEALRREGYKGQLVVIGDEPHLPYQRPPLSKKFLAGELPLDRLLVKPASFYEHVNAELRLGTRVESIDLRRKELQLSDGQTIAYERLLLATGSTARLLTVGGNQLRGVYYLRTIDDVERIREELGSARRVAIIGAGYIGLEVAATCRQLGQEVHVLEMADRVMNRVVAPEVAAFFTTEHERAGVHIHTQTLVSHIEPQQSDATRVGCVHTFDGREIPADLVIVGIGVVPTTTLAETAGLAVENGVAVDEHCRTSDEHVWAAGDCTSQPSFRYHRRVRVESVDNAFEQARTAAANMTRRQAVHDRIPWFWSDQYDLKLLIAGLNFDYDQVVVRGNPDTRAFSCCYLRGQELLAIDCVNQTKDFTVAKRLIAEHAHFDLKKLENPAVGLKEAVA
jgi:3-phenylpropionate/trans-cinnamate dioxygenase ferredoxin reductase component